MRLGTIGYSQFRSSLLKVFWIFFNFWSKWIGESVSRTCLCDENLCSFLSISIFTFASCSVLAFKIDRACFTRFSILFNETGSSVSLIREDSDRCSLEREKNQVSLREKYNKINVRKNQNLIMRFIWYSSCLLYNFWESQ